MFRHFVIIFAIILGSISSQAQIYKTEIEGLNAEQWADKIIRDGNVIFSEDYDELGEEYKTYKLLTRIIWGNPDPETQKILVEEYRTIAENSGERRHIMIMQMIDELLAGERNLTYFIENGDWFTALIAHWVDTNMFRSDKLRHSELANYYGPIIEANTEDPAYPVAMYVYTDFRRFSSAVSGELALYVRHFKENYYWIKRLYPDYDVRFLYDFDTLIMHSHLFGDPSSLKLMEHIDAFDTVSHVAGNYVVIANTRTYLLLMNGLRNEAYETASLTLESIKNASSCGDYCMRLKTLTALSAAAIGKKEEAEEILKELGPAESHSRPENFGFQIAARAILDLENPTERDIAHWLNASRDLYPQYRYSLLQQLKNPEFRFLPPTQKSPPINPIFIITSLLLASLSIGAITALWFKSRQLKELETKHKKFEERAQILEQHLNEVYSVTEMSGNHTRNTLLSLERNIDNPRTLEILDIISTSISKWAGELSNLVFSAKNLASGGFSQQEVIDFPSYERSAQERWESIARLERSSLAVSNNNLPFSFQTNRMFMDIVIDLFVQDAFARTPHDTVTVNFSSDNARQFLQVKIKDNGSRPTKFDTSLGKNDDGKTATRKTQALKTLLEIGGRFEQFIGKKNEPNEITLLLPISEIQDHPLAANSN